MSLTDYHTKYIAFDLTRRFASDSPERLAGAVASAQVDLNPHQVDAALFAFASPLSKGALMLSLFRVESLGQGEDHLIFTALADDGESLDPEVAARLMTVPGSASPLPTGEGPRLTEQALGAQTARQRVAIERQVSERNARFFEAEAQKLDGWADDLKVGLKREIKEMDRQIREVLMLCRSMRRIESIHHQKKAGGACISAR